ncbi:MAG TPA: hypothetical protein VJM57_08920 [Thermodesulfobacteriota bacterium]|nr:hypothetical protein [Thermodesulfobacteriota bacterium]
MAAWEKVKFFYDTMLGTPGSTLAATSTTSSGDYSVDYLYNMLEVNMWMAADTTDPLYITFDAGTGNTADADYIVIWGHNLATAGATVSLQYSDDNFSLDINEVFAPEAVTTDAVYVKEFTSPGPRRYWRVEITGHTAPPQMTICLWGNKTELDYATASFDPYAQEVKANVNISQGGYLAGIHTMYTERQMTLTFNNADSVLYDRIRSWWETSGVKNFFVAWDHANSPGDVFLMRPDQRFKNPFKSGGIYRDITINLQGRKE